MKTKTSQFSRWLGKNWLLVVAVVVFGILAGKVAFTRTYPLPYDEGYHFGLIQLYTHHLNPFLAGQPAGADTLGAVARDPSYLYHYLMSFPLRLIGLFTHSTLQQVVALRLLNICLEVGTLLLTIRLARRIGVSKKVAQIAALALAVTPVFFDLSGQINYDNLLIPLTLVTLLGVWQVTDAFKAGKVPFVKLSYVAALLLFSSLVKYSFLPIMAGMVAYLLAVGVRQLRTKQGMQVSINKSWSAAGAILLVLLAGTLWFQRYGVNMLTYHTPHPQCDASLSVQRCMSYAPWARNYQLHQTASERVVAGSQVVPFTLNWVRAMYYGVYATVHAQSGKVTFTSLDTARLAVKVILFGAIACALLCWRRFRATQVPWALFVLVAITYGVTLWGQNYSDFHHLHAIVAVQGRYLLPLVPLIYAVIALGYSSFIADIRSARRHRLTITELGSMPRVTIRTWRGVRRAVHSVNVALHRIPRYRTFP